MPDGSSPRTDIGLALVLIVVCAAVLWEAQDIPPGVFEPLGSAPIPQATATLIILLALVVMSRAAAAVWRGRDSAQAQDLELRPLDAALVVGLSALYVLAMALRLLDFAILTAVFLFAAIGALVRFERRLLPVIAVVAVVTGWGCQYVFTRIFVVDLPGL